MSRKVTFKADGRVLGYKPGTIYKDVELTPVLEAALRNGSNLILIDPLDLDAPPPAPTPVLVPVPPKPEPKPEPKVEKRHEAPAVHKEHKDDSPTPEKQEDSE